MSTDNTSSSNEPSLRVVPFVTPTKDTLGNRIVTTNADDEGKDAKKNIEEFPRMVKLNVGGFAFVTSRDTLCRVSGSLFESMFSGRHDHLAIQMEDGSYFIDRDGTHFRHVLNFLRVGSVVTLPEGNIHKEELAVEADYYGLDRLANAIRTPKVDITEHLSEEALLIRENEDRLRKRFVEDRSDWSQLEPYHGLVPLFCKDHGIQPLPVPYEGPGKSVKPEDIFFEDFCKQKDQPVTVDCISQFQTNFNKTHPNVLNRLSGILLEERVVIAGGSVLHALMGDNKRSWDGGDIDLFLYCQDVADANRVAERIYTSLTVGIEHWIVIRSRGVINIHHMTALAIETKVQIVLRLYDSPTEVLVGFDVDCCCCAYDGRQVWVTPRCIAALRSGMNILNPLHAWPNTSSYELRLAKYARRGFSVWVPGLNHNLIDSDKVHCEAVSKLKGMARFLKISGDIKGWFNEFRFRFYPECVPTLRSEERSCLTDDEKLVLGLDDGYDTIDSSVLVPSFYSTFGALDWRIPMHNEISFPEDDESHGAVWQQILDASESENVPDNIPKKLEDAWMKEKQSREYLNGQMDKFDLDNLYYNEAYRVDY